MTTTSYAIVSRSGFMSKVLALFGLSLLFSTGGVGLGYLLLDAMPQLFLNPVFFYGTFAVELLLIFTSRSWSQIRGLNYALFVLFTVISGFTAVPLLWYAGAVGGIGLIMRALGGTVALFAALGIYGYVTERDLSGLGGFLFAALIGIITSSVINIFLQSDAVSYVTSWVAVIIFSGFTVYDMQMIRRRYSDEMYMDAALNLYLDFFNLFLNILNILVAGSRR